MEQIYKQKMKPPNKKAFFLKKNESAEFSAD